MALDNVEWLGEEAGEYVGAISEDRLGWLANDLAHIPEDKLVVVAAHIPLLTRATDSPGVNTANLSELFAVLEGRQHLYSIAGHDTSNSWQLYLGEEEGWMGAEPFHHQVLVEVRGGGWSGPRDARGIPDSSMADGNPNGYYIISFDGNEYRTRFKAASLPEDYQIRVTLDAAGADGNRIDLGEPEIVANVFDGGERHQVEVRVDDGDFAPMEQDLRNDPFMEALAAEYAGTDEDPAIPELSSHIWVAALPTGLAPGVHTATVRRTDPYGHVVETSLAFEVVDGADGMMLAAA